MIGYAFCGSFCTLSRALLGMERLVAAGEEVLPILSDAVMHTDTRFWQAEAFCRRVEEVAGRPPVTTVAAAEPLGPKMPLEALVIAPLTGNTLAKLANGVTDTAVTMAAKAHLRQDRPLLLALASNDALATGLGNLAKFTVRRGVFFVPMSQDDPAGKPHSLVAEMERIPECLAALREGRQMLPLFT